MLVIIGASAGGAPAIREFFDAVPTDAPVTVIVAQHLSPGETELARLLLSEVSRAPVRELTDGTTLEPNVTYLLPAQTQLSFQDGRVILRRARSMSERMSAIDQAFAAVAGFAGPRAAGIVLSGEGRDGTEGVLAIRAAGGVALAQSPATAAHPAMPAAAIATGQINAVVPPDDAWAKLNELWRTRRYSAVDPLAAQIELVLDEVCRLVRERTGHDFSQYKASTVVRRIHRRIQVCRLKDADAYVNFLAQSNDEIDTLFNELLINVTAFFRDPQVFAALSDRVLQPLIQASPPDRKLRLWVPGCSTGEEAYTFGILLIEIFESLGRCPNAQIIATDIDHAALATARRGIYGASIAEGLASNQLSRFFTARGDRYRVTKQLRDLCLFSAHNLTADPPYSRLDLISCRNVLIYLGAPLQQKLIPVFHHALRPGGHLLLGNSETVTAHQDLFYSVDPKNRILRRSEAPRVDGPVNVGSPPRAARSPELDHELVGHLERELERTVQDLEASNEELKSSNEELLSMNEELQSANEEVRTTNEALQRANLNLANLLASTQIATLFLDGNFAIRGFTPAAAEIYNVRSTDVGRPLGDFTSRALRMPAYPALPLGPEVVREDVTMPDGRIFERRILPYQSATREADGVVVTFIDVTDARRGEHRFRQLADSVPVITWTAGPTGDVHFFNSRWYEYTGQAPLVGGLGWEWNVVLHPDDLARTEEIWRESLASGRDYRIEYRLRRTDGAYRWHRGAAVAVRDGGPDVTAWFGTCVDIHEQRERTDLLEASGRALRTIVEAIPQYVWRTTPDGAADYASERFQRFTGWTEAELLGWGWLDLIHPDDRPAVEADWAVRRAAAESIVVEFRLRPGGPAGGRWIRSEGAPYFNSAGELTNYYGTWTDVTEQRRAAEAIRSSESHFRTLVDHSPATMWITDVEGSCTYLSTKWYEIVGRTPEQDLGHGWIENLHPDDRAPTGDAFFSSLATRARFAARYRLRQADGTYRWTLDAGSPLMSPDGEFLGYIGTVIDIDDQVANERNLNLLRERFDRSAAATDLGIWYCDLPFDRLIWNEEVRRHFFVPNEGEVTIDDFYAHIHPEEREMVRAAIAFSVEHRAPYDVEFRTFDAVDPGRFKWVRAIGWTDYADGRPVRFDGITLDTSDEHRRKNELTEAKHEADRARRAAEDASESKTRFLANMSHEIRTPLSAIAGYSDLLRGLVHESCGPDSEARAFLDRISRNSVHLSRLIDELLDLSKIEADKLEIERAPADVERIVDDVLAAMHLQAESKGLAITVRWEVERPLRVVTDPVRLAQILTNILGNAVKFTEAGRVELRVSRVADRLRFLVADTGIGLAPEQRERIFEPFTQADPSVSRRYGGTGLGLHLSRQFARLLGGDLQLGASEPGRGSVFSIEIVAPPVAAPSKGDVQRLPGRSSASPLGGRTILVVDDSPDNRTIVGLFLSSAGARVEEAANGAEAVDLALKDSFDLVLMDIQMPTMDGYQALAKLRQFGFVPPVVALTAHAFKEERDRCLRVGFNSYLTKPVARATLVQTVRQILDDPPG